MLRLLATAFFALCLLLPFLASHADGLRQQGDTTHTVTLYATDSNGNALNGLTVTVYVSHSGGTSSTLATGTISQPDTTHQPGIYFYTPTPADVGTLGDVVYYPSSPGAVFNVIREQVVAFNPNDAAALGLSGVTTAATQATSANTNTGTLLTGQAAQTATLALLKSAHVLATGTISDGSSTTTVLDTNLPTSAGDIYTGDALVITSGTYAGKVIHIAGFNTANGQVTSESTLPAALPSGVTFSLVPFSKGLMLLTSGGIDTVGKVVISATDTQAQTEDAAALTAYGPQKAGVAVTLPTAPSGYGGLTAQQTASAVWDEPTASHTTAGTFGLFVTSLPTTGAIWTYAGGSGRTLTGGVTVTTNNDKTGYSGTATNFVAPPTAVQNRQEMDANSTQLAAIASGLQTANTGITANGTAIAGLPTASQIVQAMFTAAYITIPADHTTTGVSEVLTQKQINALLQAVIDGDDVTSAAPAPNTTITVSYYLPGQDAGPSTLLGVATLTYGSAEQQTGRTFKYAQPFPAVQ